MMRKSFGIVHPLFPSLRIVGVDLFEDLQDQLGRIGKGACHLDKAPTTMSIAMGGYRLGPFGVITI
jgi:hypothetical protein